MRLIEIEKRAKALMLQHGVGHVGFRFDNAKRRLGATHFKLCDNGAYLPVEITLSRHFAEVLSDEELDQTMVHEIAHVKAGRDEGHGPKWRAIAISLGHSGKRCASPTARPEPPVKGFCVVCEKKVHEAHRLPQRVYYHASCGRVSLRWERKGVILAMSDMPLRFQNEHRRWFA